MEFKLKRDYFYTYGQDGEVLFEKTAFGMWSLYADESLGSGHQFMTADKAYFLSIMIGMMTSFSDDELEKATTLARTLRNGEASGMDYNSVKQVFDDGK